MQADDRRFFLTKRGRESEALYALKSVINTHRTYEDEMETQAIGERIEPSGGRVSNT